MDVELTGVSLPSFSVYSERYVGYAIDQGKLRLTLDYALDAYRASGNAPFVINGLLLRKSCSNFRDSSSRKTRFCMCGL